MKHLNRSSVPLLTVLPFLCVLSLSTVFNVILTWNDLRLLANLRMITELKDQPGVNEALIRLEPVVQLVDANGHYNVTADDEWASLQPFNHAIGVDLNQTEGQRKFKFISVYHQLSCLNTLRRLYINPGWEHDHNKLRKAHDCLNVLRQAVLCNGDTTLEPSHLEEDSNGNMVPAASGMDVLHVCRNWAELRALAEQNFRER